MIDDQEMNLSYVSDIKRRLVSSSQPRIFLNSSITDSVSILATEIIYFLWMILLCVSGLPMMFISRYTNSSSMDRPLSPLISTVVVFPIYMSGPIPNLVAQLILIKLFLDNNCELNSLKPYHIKPQSSCFCTLLAF